MFSAFHSDGSPVEAGEILFSAHDGNAYEFVSVDFDRSHRAPMVRAIRTDRESRTVSVLSPSLFAIYAAKE